MHEIIRHLFVGDLSDVHRPGWLQHKKIKCIINPAEQPIDAHGIEIMKIPINDSKESMLEYFPEIIRKIHAHRIKRENVLVHCAAGMSRGPTAALAYLVCVTFFFPTYCLQFMAKRRSQVSINPIFYSDIMAFFRSPEREALNKELGLIPDHLNVCNLMNSYLRDPQLANDIEIQTEIQSWVKAKAYARKIEERVHRRVAELEDQ